MSNPVHERPIVRDRVIELTRADFDASLLHKKVLDSVFYLEGHQRPGVITRASQTAAQFPGFSAIYRVTIDLTDSKSVNEKGIPAIIGIKE